MKRLLIITLHLLFSFQTNFGIIPAITNLSLEQKIGQLFMIPVVSNETHNANFMQNSPYRMDHTYTAHLITKYHVGGVIFLGHGITKEQVTITQQLQKLSLTPLLVGQDLEWGLSMRLHDGIQFPHAMTLGALPPECDHLIYECGKEIGMQCKAIGVHINFAPVVDVNNNPNNPIIHDRSFGDNPKRVAHKAILFARGMRDAGILPCAKHFPGHGDTATDSHVGLPVIHHNLKHLNTIELAPFRALIAHGIDAVMTAHLAVPALTGSQTEPTSLSRIATTDLLRNQMSFNGLIVTDGLGMRGVTANTQPGDVELRALLAGNDLLVAPVHVPAAIALIKNALADGTLSEQELDEHVQRILDAKRGISFESFKHDLHNSNAYTLKKELYRNAITLIKNENNLIPLDTTKYNIAIHILGTDQSTPLKTSFNTPHNPYKETIHIIGIFGINKKTLLEMRHTESNNTSNIASTINAIQGTKIVILFGSPYALEHIHNANTIIVAYEDDIDAQKAAVDVIKGNLKARGILPITV